jgi:predicted nucleic acid-binding protein
VITLDASVLIAHLWPRDEHHQLATQFLAQHADEALLIHPLNLAEVLVGGARVGRGQEMLTDLEAMGVRPASPVEGESLRLAVLRADTRLKLPDCCALDTALSHDADLATLDEALGSVARSAEIRVHP